MNDRFKFRIWHEPLKQMHYNDFIVTATGYMAKIYQQDDYMMKFNQEDLEFDKQCILMQCTGLKDKNGKLIYEGDILKRPVSYPKNSYFYEVVIWERKRWQLARPQKCNCQFPQKQCRHCEKIPERKNWFFQNNDTSFKNFYESEVVGNIYENKELLDERN